MVGSVNEPIVRELFSALPYACGNSSAISAKITL
jgi:hypothetical protein